MAKLFMQFQWQALLGGILIGLSAILLFVLTRRIAGVSGIVKTALFGDKNDSIERYWSIFFLIGLMLGAYIFSQFYSIETVLRIDYSKPILIASGLLVGFGTAIGRGCTSGHGVCGIGRLSKRSFVATCIFMIAGIVTVTLLRHLF